MLTEDAPAGRRPANLETSEAGVEAAYGADDIHPTCRVLSDPEVRCGSWNMAVDELLLEAALERGDVSVRWYRWSEATLSLGYFQAPEAADADVRVRDLPRVRRLSGGGAIVHHHELTYSCALPPRHPLARQPGRLYREVHQSIIDVLAECGVTAHFRAATDVAANAGLLCFLRGDVNDVLCVGHKILGSAQRRRRGAVLQHGSLLLKASPFAPELPGLADLVDEVPADAELEQRLWPALLATLGDDWQWSSLSCSETQRVKDLERIRYRSAGVSESGTEFR